MAYFDYGPRYICGRLAKTQFEQSYENPEPKIYDEYTLFDSFTDFADTALRSLESWKRTYRSAIGEYLVRPRDSMRHLYSSSLGQSGPLDEFRRRQIEWILGDDGVFDRAIEANGFAEQCGYLFHECWEPNEFKRATPDGLADYFDHLACDHFGFALDDVAAWLDSREFAPSVPYREGVLSSEVEEMADRLAAHAKVIGCETSDVGCGEGWNGTEWQDLRSGLDMRFGDYATAGALLTNCLEAKSIQTYRWEFNCEDEVNFIREAYLAGVRRWLDRILSNRIPFSSGEDFAAFNRLARVALEIVREAYTREAPSSLLGEDECDILRLAFPLMEQFPAETSVDEDELRRQWAAFTDAEREEFGSSPDEFVNDFRFFSFSLYDEVGRRWREQPPRKLETDFECRRIGVALAKWMAAEASRGRVASRIAVADISDEQEALKRISDIAVECAATLELKFTEQPTEPFPPAETAIPTLDSTTAENRSPATTAELQTRKQVDGKAKPSWLHGVGEDPPQDFYRGDWITDAQTKIGFAVRPPKFRVVGDRQLLNSLIAAATATEKKKPQVWCRATIIDKVIDAFFRDSDALKSAKDRIATYSTPNSAEADGSPRKSPEVTSDENEETR